MATRSSKRSSKLSYPSYDIDFGEGPKGPFTFPPLSKLYPSGMITLQVGDLFEDGEEVLIAADPIKEEIFIYKEIYEELKQGPGQLRKYKLRKNAARFICKPRHLVLLESVRPGEYKHRNIVDANKMFLGVALSRHESEGSRYLCRVKVTEEPAYSQYIDKNLPVVREQFLRRYFNARISYMEYEQMIKGGLIGKGGWRNLRLQGRHLQSGEGLPPIADSKGGGPGRPAGLHDDDQGSPGRIKEGNRGRNRKAQSQ